MKMGWLKLNAIRRRLKLWRKNHQASSPSKHINLLVVDLNTSASRLTAK
jgi:hypothetical protein